MKINFNRIIRSNLLKKMNVMRNFDRNFRKREEHTGIELQVFANRTLASSAQNYTHQLFVKDQEILHLQKQIKKRNNTIKALSTSLIVTSILAMLFWAWAIHLRDSIIWHNYQEHNKNIERVVIDEVE